MVARLFSSVVRRFLFLSFCATVVTLVTCSNHDKQYVVAVSSCSNDMWREKLNEELLVSTYLYDNVKLKIQSANDDDKRQIEQINKFVDEGVDLLIVSPNQLKAISPAVNRAYAHNIPVVLFDRKTDTSHYTAYIGADNFKVGRDMGEYVAHLMNGRGNLVVIKGLEGSSPAIERNEGFMSVVSKYPAIKVVATTYAGWLYEGAEVAMDSILRSTTDIDCVFAQNDRMALGARAAVERHGLSRHIDYVGVDALPTAGGGLECVNKGLLKASYIYPTRGDLVMNLVMNILTGKKYERENKLQGALVTEDNARVLLLQNEELNKQRDRLYTIHDRVDLYFTQYSHQRIYTLMAIAIIVLLVISITLLYRTFAIRRRLTDEAVEAKLTFFTNISHEFRTPLTLIADPVDRLLADPDTSDTQLPLLRLVRSNVDVMLRLVEQILDFRKVQKDKMKLCLEKFNVGGALRQWMDMFSPAAEKKNIEMTLSVAPDTTAVADVDKLGKIVCNLLANSLKFTAEGGHVRVTASSTSGGGLTLTVNDDGRGMTEEECSHVFERFYQTGDTVGGTGIGLALVKALTDLHGGMVSVESQRGKGTSFVITLPAAQPTTDGLKAVVADRESPHPQSFVEDYGNEENAGKGENEDKIAILDRASSTRPTALVVDDNADVRRYVADLLNARYEVVTATDGNDGLAQANACHPDIIIADVMMPGIDGLEMCRRLKQQKETAHTPIILLTARAMDDQRVEGYVCGADAYISKPFSGQVLLARMENLLAQRRQLRELFANDEIALDGKACDEDRIFIKEFQKIVVARLGNASLSVDDVAEVMNVTSSKLYRRVKQLTGYSAAEMIRAIRMRKANELLRNSQRTVSEISYMLGFSSPSYFTKCYKEFFHRLPSE